MKSTETAYHITPACNVDSILQNGLKPEIGDRSAELGEFHPRVYLFPDETAMNDGLGNWLGEALEDFDELAILKINVRGIHLDSEVEWELVCNSIIEPNRIEVIRFE